MIHAQTENIIGFPERRNKRKKCFGNNKNVLFLNLNDKIIEQEMNKMAIHCIPMLFSDLVTPCSFLFYVPANR